MASFDLVTVTTAPSSTSSDTVTVTTSPNTATGVQVRVRWRGATVIATRWHRRKGVNEQTGG
jgi:hypothetical protein